MLTDLIFNFINFGRLVLETFGTVADPDLDPKDPNHFAGSGSEIIVSDLEPKHTFVEKS